MDLWRTPNGFFTVFIQNIGPVHIWYSSVSSEMIMWRGRTHVFCTPDGINASPVITWMDFMHRLFSVLCQPLAEIFQRSHLLNLSNTSIIWSTNKTYIWTGDEMMKGAIKSSCHCPCCYSIALCLSVSLLWTLLLETPGGAFAFSLQM